MTSIPRPSDQDLHRAGTLTGWVGVRTFLEPVPVGLPGACVHYQTRAGPVRMCRRHMRPFTYVLPFGEAHGHGHLRSPGSRVCSDLFHGVAAGVVCGTFATCRPLPHHWVNWDSLPAKRCGGSFPQSGWGFTRAGCSPVSAARRRRRHVARTSRIFFQSGLPQLSAAARRR